MSNLFHQLNNWCLKYQEQFARWFSQDSRETTPPQNSLEELPPSIRQKLEHLIQNLPTHSSTQNHFTYPKLIGQDSQTIN